MDRFLPKCVTGFEVHPAFVLSAEILLRPQLCSDAKVILCCVVKEEILRVVDTCWKEFFLFFCPQRPPTGVAAQDGKVAASWQLDLIYILRDQNCLSRLSKYWSLLLCQLVHFDSTL